MCGFRLTILHRRDRDEKENNSRPASYGNGHVHGLRMWEGKEKTGIYFDKSIVLKTEIAKMFIEYMQINVDENLVLTAMLLCNCKKVENAQKIEQKLFAHDNLVRN